MTTEISIRKKVWLRLGEDSTMFFVSYSRKAYKQTVSNDETMDEFPQVRKNKDYQY